MAVLRFKPRFLKSIIEPLIIDTGTFNIGYFKTYTTRLKPKKIGEYEVICGVPPRPLFFRIKTGIIIKIEEVQNKPIKEYSASELIGDVGHASVECFVNELNDINKSRKTQRLTSDWKGYLHKFHYVSGGENVDNTLEKIKQLSDSWAMFKAENPELPYRKLCKMFAKR